MTTTNLYLGDCLDVMRTLDAGSVDAIITDLPYQVTNCNWDTIIPFVPMWEQVKRILKPRGAFVTTASQPFTSKLVMSNLKWFKYTWVWEKDLGTRHLDAKRRPLLFHEDVVVFASGQPVYNPQKWAGKINHSRNTRESGSGSLYGSAKERGAVDKSGMKYPRSIIRMCALAPMVRLHPTQKPIALYAYLIRTYTNENAVVLDFAMGSGTAGVACMQTGRNFIGIEIDPSYFAIAQKRIEQARAELPSAEVAG